MAQAQDLTGDCSRKRRLLNTVNTEYQKRVMDRLTLLAEELYSEFDPASESFWVKNDPVVEVVAEINKMFRDGGALILKEGKWSLGIPVSRDYAKLSGFVSKVKSDPFIPKRIREQLVDLLEARVQTLRTAYEEVIREYADSLAKGLHGDTLDENGYWLHNEINKLCYECGCGISQIEEEVHRLRLYVQQYLESFNPFRR
jgi:hypothetical protein